jgi:hypothetical protein
VQLKTAILAHDFDEPFYLLVGGGVREGLPDLEVEALGLGGNYILRQDQVCDCVCVCVCVCASVCMYVRL